MGFPVNGATATVSSVTASTDIKYLIDVLKISEMTVNIEGEDFDISELSGSGAAVERLSGLRSGSFDFVGYWPKAAPKIGNVGLVTLSGYANYVTDYKIDVDFGEQDITAFAATPPTVRAFMPSGLFTWGGTFNAHAVSDTAVGLPTAASSTGSAATFILSNEATHDSKLSGNVLITRVGHAVRKADKQVLAYTFQGSGALTETVGDTYDALRLDPAAAAGTATAWSAPSWDTNGDGTPDVSLEFTSYNGTADSKYTASVFLKSLSIECNVGQPIRVSGNIRMTHSIAATNA
jgi:hypothetical protein